MPQPHPMRLTPAEMLEAGFAAVMREVEDRKNGAKTDTHGYENKNPWQIAITGAIAERAVAKAAGLYWYGKGSVGAPDVYPQIEVRSTEHPHGKLIVHKSDPDERPFFLVCVSYDTCLIMGWMFAKHAKQEKWWSDPTGKNRHAYFVPPNELRSFEDQGYLSVLQSSKRPPP